MSHLDISELLAYADPALEGAARETAQTHIETCDRCRARVISLQTLKTALNKSPQNLVPFKLTGQCVPEDLMGDYLGNRLPVDERSVYSTHLKDCDICFERAAYFSWSSANMTAGVLTMIGSTPERYKNAVLNRDPEPEQTVKVEKPSIWEIVSEWLASPLPAYAFAASLLFFLLFGASKQSADIIDIGSSETFALYEQPMQSGPSFGFSDSGKKVGEATAGLSVTKTGDDRLKFSWNEVAGAQGYNFYLTEINANGASDIYDTKTGETYVLAPHGLTLVGKAYRWKVTGSTDTDNIFVAQGQFVHAR